jgi:hypothetical protein
LKLPATHTRRSNQDAVRPLRNFAVDQGKAGVALHRRCGIPFDSQTPEDENSLFNMLVSTPTDMGYDIRSLYVRRSSFYSWFRPEPLDLTYSVELDPNIVELDVHGTNGREDGNGVENYGMQDSRIRDNHLEDHGIQDTGMQDNATRTQGQRRGGQRHG